MDSYWSLKYVFSKETDCYGKVNAKVDKQNRYLLLDFKMLKYLKSDLTEARGIIVIWAVLEI